MPNTTGSDEPNTQFVFSEREIEILEVMNSEDSNSEVLEVRNSGDGGNAVVNTVPAVFQWNQVRVLYAFPVLQLVHYKCRTVTQPSFSGSSSPLPRYLIPTPLVKVPKCLFLLVPQPPFQGYISASEPHPNHTLMRSLVLLQASKFPAARITSEHAILKRRMLAIKSLFELELDMTLRGVLEQDVIVTLLKKLESGVLLCKLVAKQCVAMGETLEEPHRPVPVSR